MSQLLFFTLSAMTILSALVVVFTRKPMYSVLSLIVCFFTIAGHYILLNAQFLAITHIIVYAGAIMVLFLFVLMLLNLNKDTEPQKSTRFKMIGVGSGGLLLVVMVGAMKGAGLVAQPGIADANIGLTKNLGKVLFTDFVVPFEIASILFLAAMVGAVMVGKKDQKDNNIHL